MPRAQPEPFLPFPTALKRHLVNPLTAGEIAMEGTQR